MHTSCLILGDIFAIIYRAHALFACRCLLPSATGGCVALVLLDGEQSMTAACTDAALPMQFGMATAMATEVLKNDFDTLHM